MIDATRALQILRKCPSGKNFRTAGGRGSPYTLKIRDAGRGPGVEFIRATGGSKSASLQRFSEFWDIWASGKRDPRYFLNKTGDRTPAAVARYMIPVFEWIEKQE